MDSNGYHNEFKNHPERISDMHHFFSRQYNWDDIEFPAVSKVSKNIFLIISLHCVKIKRK